MHLDAGPFVVALEYASTQSALVLGKPSKPYFDMVLEDIAIPPNRLAIVGDDIEIDVRGAQQWGMQGWLVKTGRFSQIDLRQGIWPNRILDSFSVTRIKIDGFKSFKEFEMTFTPLTVVAGANASGKSNLFDALMLLSRLAETDLKTAFSEQRGNPSELFTQFDDEWYASKMQFTVEMLIGRKATDNWGGEVELNNTRLRYELTIGRKSNDLGIDDLSVEHEHLEKIKYEDDHWVKTTLPKAAKPFWRTERAGGSHKPFIETVKQNGVITIQIRQDGNQGRKATSANAAAQTILSGVNSVDFAHVFAVKEEMRSWKFLQLNPEDLRQPSRQDVGLRDTITPSGKNLAAALFRIKHQDRYNLKEISRKLNSFLPNFTDVDVYDDKANRQFIIKVKGEDGKEFTSRVLSEGTLRLLALCIIEYDDMHTGLLCFEEPENGVHLARLKTMANLLKDLSMDFNDIDSPLRQVIVNTHSPTLVSQLIQWSGDANVSVWLSRLHTTIHSSITGDKKVKLKITRMNPVTASLEKTLFPFTEQERKYTHSEAIDYLETADLEIADAIKAIQ